MLADDQAGHGFQYLTRAVNRAGVELFLGDQTFVGGTASPSTLLRELSTVTVPRVGGLLVLLLCPPGLTAERTKANYCGENGIEFKSFGYGFKGFG